MHNLVAGKLNTALLNMTCLKAATEEPWDICITSIIYGENNF